MLFTPAVGVNIVVVDPSVITASVDFCNENFQKLNEKSQPNGYASLDTTGKVPKSELPDFAESFNNKMDIDAANISTIGKNNLAALGMPSDTVVELTLGATNSTHIAPANGYMSFTASTTAANGYVGLTRDDSDTIPEIAGLSYSPTAGKAVSVTIPVKMGDTVRSTYNNIGYTHLRFINAEGDQ